jgi:hypothetical protein
MSASTKTQRFDTLCRKLTEVINNELFLSPEQKRDLTDEICGINQCIQAGSLGVEKRLYAVWNSLRQYRIENLFPSRRRGI